MKAPLPPACPLCRPERGLWMRTPSGLHALRLRTGPQFISAAN